MISRLILPVCGVLLAGCAGRTPVRLVEEDCRRTSGPITIDGRADEPSWKAVPVIGFMAHWAGAPPRTVTRARLLWDDRALYFFAEMEDGDLFADIVEHDGRCWENDVFELFFKPDDVRPGYYEFNINAANTVMDMYLPGRGTGGYDQWSTVGTFHVKTAVVLKGTLNERTDRDTSWSVEGRIPWIDFLPTGGRPSPGDVWAFALCRYDYDVTFEAPDLSSSAPLTERSFHRYEDYGRLRFSGR